MDVLWYQFNMGKDALLINLMLFLFFSGGRFRMHNVILYESGSAENQSFFYIGCY